MRLTERRGINHSLTSNLIKFNQQREDTNNQTPSLYNPKYIDFTSIKSNRSRKHRLAEERNTEIEKTNRMLYERIRKIMQKGNRSQSKLPNQNNSDDQQDILNSSKPFSLPIVSNQNEKYQYNKQSQLNQILQDRRTYVEKYFRDLDVVRGKMKSKPVQLGRFETNGWKVVVLLTNEGQFIVLRGKKKKKQMDKKYIYAKVKEKISNSSLEQWVAAKFQFEL